MVSCILITICRMSESQKAEIDFSNKNGNVGQRIDRLPSFAEASPKTPEQDEGANQRRINAFSNAPKTKLIGPPILKMKIKPQDAVAIGIGTEQYKTIKPSKRILLQRAQSSNCRVNPASLELTSYMNQHQSPDNTRISTVQVSKGIAMKRIDKVGPTNEWSASGNTVSRNVTLGNIGKKTEKKSKYNGLKKNMKGRMKTNTSTSSVELGKFNTPTPDKIEVESVRNPISERLGPSNENSLCGAYDYKTLEEFLGMSEIQLPELNSKKNIPNIDKPKPLFKSQFWEYLDPYKKREDNRYAKNKEKEKAYDPVEVKSYMEKQKEIRKLKESREYKERQQELERKKKLLHDLNEKCRSINAKRSIVARKSAPSTAPVFSDSQVLQSEQTFVKPKPRHSERIVKCPSIESQMLPTRIAETSSKNGKYSSEQDVNATMLLKEFEDIVKKECMHVLKRHMKKIPGEPNKCSSRLQSYDKAVETTISLERNNDIFLCSTDSSTPSLLADEASFNKRATPSHRISQKQLNLAATKIQAWVRGCQTRKYLREANIIPYLRHKRDPRCRRRMSFYRTPEKPFDSPIQRKLSCVSPAKIPTIVQAYVPAKEQSVFNELSATISSSRNLMPTSIRLKPFDEPFPREVIKKIQQQRQQLNIIAKSTNNTRYSSEGFGRIGTDFMDEVNVQLTTNQYPTLERQFTSESPLSTFIPTSTNIYQKIGVPTPTIAEVLKEKVRTFSQDLQTREMLKDSLHKKSSSDNYIQNGSLFHTSSRPRYDIGFESEPQTLTHLKTYQPGVKASPLHVVTSEIIESSVTEVSHNRHKGLEPSKEKRVFENSKDMEDSTTTVDTDVELVSNTTREFSMMSSSTESSTMNSNTEQKTGGTILTSTNFPSSSVNINSLPTPALELCYKAEVERLQVLERAYQLTLNRERNQQFVEKQKFLQETEAKYRLNMEATVKQEKKELNLSRDRGSTQIPKTEQLPKEMEGVIKRHSESSPRSADVNLALMNCQKEALSATAEIAKLMSELKKASVEKDMIELQQQPINMASMVYAAVDEARRRDEDRRQKRKEMKLRRDLKKKDLGEKEQEKNKIQAKRSSVTYQDKEVQFPTSSMSDSYRQTSAQEGQTKKHHRRYDSVRKSEMVSVNKIEGQLDKQLQQAKLVLQGIYINEDTSENQFQHDRNSINSDPSENQFQHDRNSINSDPSYIHIIEDDNTSVLHNIHNINNRISPASSSDKDKEYNSPNLSENFQISKESNDKKCKPLLNEMKLKNSEVSQVYSQQSSIMDDMVSDMATETSLSPYEIEEENEGGISDTLSGVKKYDFSAIKAKSQSENFKRETAAAENEKCSTDTYVGSEIFQSLDCIKSSNICETKNDVSTENPHSEIEYDEKEESFEGEVVTEDNFDLINERFSMENSKCQDKLKEDEIEFKTTTTPILNNGEVVESKMTKPPTIFEPLIVDKNTISTEPQNYKTEEKVPIQDSNASENIESQNFDLLESIIPNEVSLEQEEYVSTESPISDILTKEESCKSEIVIADNNKSLELEEFTDESNKNTHSIDGTNDSELRMPEIKIPHATEESISPHANSKVEEMQVEDEESFANELVSEKQNEDSQSLLGFNEGNEGVPMNETDAEQSMKPFHDMEEREDVSTDIPGSDVENEDEESFEDDIDSDYNGELMKEKEQSLPSENVVDVADTMTDDSKFTLERNSEFKTETEQMKISTKSLTTPNVKEDDNFLMRSTNFEIEAEEDEWFEDEMVSDVKEDEALKLEAAKIEEEQNRIENEIRALEALQAQVPPITHRASLSDIPDKPPPPYSPPSSDSFSLSSRSIVTAVTDRKIEEIVFKQVNEVWNVWVETKTVPPVRYYTINDCERNPNDTADDATSVTGFQSVQQSANRALDSLLNDFVRQTIRELLLADEINMSYLEKARPGPITFQAQQIRIPKTKEVLITGVMAITKNNTPFGIVSDTNVNPLEYGTAWKKRLTKWSSRPRDQVDEILVEELIQENSEWTEFWPEELIVTDKACKKIVRSALKNVLRNLKTASTTKSSR